MAPLPQIFNVYRVAIDYATDDGSQTAENVIHVLNAVDFPNKAEQTATQVENALNAAHVGGSDILAAMSDAAAIRGCHVTPLDGLSATFHKPFIVSGSEAGQFVPQVAIVTTHYTPLRGRSYRGRTYCPFVGEGAIEDGLMASGGNRASIEAGWNLFRTNLHLGTDTPDFAVASYGPYKDRGVNRGATPVFNSITQPVLATQRRRQSRLR